DHLALGGFVHTQDGRLGLSFCDGLCYHESEPFLFVVPVGVAAPPGLFLLPPGSVAVAVRSYNPIIAVSVHLSIFILLFLYIRTDSSQQKSPATNEPGNWMRD